MDKIVIEGGRRLEGEIQISGAKNAALPALCATLLCPGRFVISRVPRLRDIDTTIKLLSGLGVEIGWDGENVLAVNSENLKNVEAPYDLVRTMRASCLVLGPLIARMGGARISLPGGCAIGERPINLHLKGFQKLGADISLDHGYVTADASDGLKGGRVYFDIVTVTGTANLMMAATAAAGETVLENCAREPELLFLAEMLKSMGAEIKGAGTDRITIKGGRKLKPADISIIPDRVETGSFMAAAAITGGHLVLKDCNPADVESVTSKLVETGCKAQCGDNFIEITGPEKLKPVDLETAPFPGFPTDMQAQMMAVLAVADGTSVITETVFENRFMHIAELRRMGANIKHSGSTAIVNGVDRLFGAEVLATDLRASASLIIAGLAARGKTELRRVYHLDRGYQRIEEKLERAGANVCRVKDV
ncbi:MAG: UDP-N-acetylglucosamine 1-carboxyvinyltransferase [bacterium]|nr:MAG: UDP-N-acetylglucosamine 1-carboxyvinyltransferase [bacterium]